MRTQLLGILSAIFLCMPFLSAAEPPIRVGMELAYPPFEMIDAQGNPEGVSVELAKALGAHLQREVIIENMSFDGLIPALKSGKLDCVISSMTANDERRRSIDFSEPYVKTGLAFLVGKEVAVKGIIDLNQRGKRIAVKRGTTGHLYAMDHLKEATLLVLDKENAAVLEVVQGKADAFIYDQLSIYNNWKRNQTTTLAVLEPFQSEVWAIGVRKGDTELAAKINEFLIKFRAEAGFEKLAERFFADERLEFKAKGVDFLF